MITTLRSELEGIGPIRTYFSRFIDRRDKIIDFWNSRQREETQQISRLFSVTGSEEPYHIVRIDGMDFRFLFRRSRQNFGFVQDYDTSHLRNSVIANSMLKEEIQMKDRLDMVMFVWYYYWFFKDRRDINNLTHNVCFEIEEMIKLIIQKELTLYRTYNTAEILQSLRWRLSAERLLGSERRSSINFRR